jgi:hypothetical protein
VRGWRAGVVVLLLAVGFVWGMLHLFGEQFSTGDVYPEYSSLRSDPMGSRLLYESLARVPGLKVTRNYLPLPYFPEASATLLLVATSPDLLRETEFLRLMERVAGRGHRVVITCAGVPAGVEALALQTTWQVRLATVSRQAYFAEAKDWKTLETEGDRIRAVERAFGKGTVVLFADSDLFANASAMELKRLTPVAAALGSNRTIVFDESHFGIIESGSVVGLARRYRLLGLALGLALCAALALWRNASAFPPRGESLEPERLSGRTSFAGLVTLLRRHLPAADLTSVCWQEWLKTNRRVISPARARRAEELAAEKAARPLDAVREMQAVVRAKGEL